MVGLERVEDLIGDLDVENRLIKLCTGALEVFTTLPARYKAAVTIDKAAEDNIEDDDTVGLDGEKTRRRNTRLMTEEALVPPEEELRFRAPLTLAVLKAVVALGGKVFTKHLSAFFPLVTDLIATEACPQEVRVALKGFFRDLVEPLLEELSGTEPTQQQQPQQQQQQ